MKKLLSILLVILMICSAVPMVSALDFVHSHSIGVDCSEQEGEQHIFIPLTKAYFNVTDTATEGDCLLREGNYYLAEDIEFNDSLGLRILGNVKLCLNGHTIRNTYQKSGAFVAVIRLSSENCHLDICDCGENGTIEGQFGIQIYDSNSVNLYGGTVKANGNVGAGVDVMENAVFTMYDGQIKSEYKGATVSGKAVIKGGTFDAPIKNNDGEVIIENCDHLCHDNGLFWMIINFFCKLFGINPFCECGLEHY